MRGDTSAPDPVRKTDAPTQVTGQPSTDGPRRDSEQQKRKHRSTPTSLTEEDAASYIGFGLDFLRLARRQGRGPAYIRVGRTIRYRLRDLDAWLDAHRVVPTGARARKRASK